MAESSKGFGAHFWNSVKTPFLFLVVLWGVHALNILQFFRPVAWGVIPRESFGLPGIFTSPFIHGDFGHLISNSVPLFILMAMILFFYKRVAWPSIAVMYVLTGIAVWIFARPVSHIGASGVVYAFVAFIFWMGIFRRNARSIVLALVVLFFFQGMFVGIFPVKEGVSWESHLFGAIVGIFTAYLFKNRIEAEEKKPEPLPDEPEEFFLDRDAFG